MRHQFPRLEHIAGGFIIAVLIGCRPSSPAVGVSEQLDQAQTVSEAVDTRRPFWTTMFPKWTESVEPFRIVGDIYYVGTKGLAVYFLPSEHGHILIDGGLPGQGDYIAAQVKSLGYDPQDVAYILNTHAHFDHSGGFAELKALTGAKLLISAADKPAVEQGVYLGSEEIIDYQMPPVEVDGVIEDGQVISLGGWNLTAELTPGHSPGCTSWKTTVEEETVALDVLWFCSATVAANRLNDPPQYPGIIEAYRSTFAKARDWRPDVFLANHAEVFLMEEKRARMDKEGQTVFVDPDHFPKYIAAKEKLFEEAISHLEKE